MAWKGLSILAMGFTGDKAYQWKQDFLDAFEALGDEIYRIKSRQFDLDWQQQRLEKLKNTLLMGLGQTYIDRKTALHQYAIALRIPVQPALTRHNPQRALAA